MLRFQHKIWKTIDFLSVLSSAVSSHAQSSSFGSKSSARIFPENESIEERRWEKRAFLTRFVLLQHFGHDVSKIRFPFVIIIVDVDRRYARLTSGVLHFSDASADRFNDSDQFYVSKDPPSSSSSHSPCSYLRCLRNLNDWSHQSKATLCHVCPVPYLSRLNWIIAESSLISVGMLKAKHRWTFYAAESSDQESKSSFLFLHSMTGERWCWKNRTTSVGCTLKIKMDLPKIFGN